MYYVKTKWSNAKHCRGFDSKFEAGYERELSQRKKAGDIADYQCQVKIPLIVNGYVVADYWIDFVITHNDGTLEYVETKGRPGEVWKHKWKLFEALYSDKPDVRLTVEYQGKRWNPRLRKAIGGKHRR
jgi:hypothetical protein